LYDDKEEELETRKRRGSSFDGNDYYTHNSPFESSILGARYLTNTSTEGAMKICEAAGPDGICSRDVILSTRDCINATFPLEGPDGDRNSKRVIELAMSLPEEHKIKYQPGDSIGLLVENTPEAVKFVLNMLKEKHGIDATQKILIDASETMTVEEAVRTQIDLSSPIKSKRVLYSLVQFASDQEDAKVLSVLSSKTTKGDMLFEKYVVQQCKSMVDVLQDFPSCQSIDLNGLLAVLPAIPPRYYSVSSSPLDKSRDGAHSLTITFSVVDFLTPSLMVNKKEQGKRRIYGLATRHLEALCAPFLCQSKSSSTSIPLKIFPKPTAEFVLPPSLKTPLVLIGPGTGIAPFIGFLAHRRALVAEKDSSERVGKVDVFFGCRHSDHDYLYKNELEEFCKDGTISKLNVAFSRDGGKNKYVQDIMKCDEECSSRLADLMLFKQGSLYICGDGNKMGRDVQRAIAELLGRELGGDRKAGEKMIDDLKKNGRFVLDIWS
jgi:sulfite reductase alpha subunit-like flavoprotein